MKWFVSIIYEYITYILSKCNTFDKKYQKGEAGAEGQTVADKIKKKAISCERLPFLSE